MEHEGRSTQLVRIVDTGQPENRDASGPGVQLKQRPPRAQLPATKASGTWASRGSLRLPERGPEEAIGWAMVFSRFFWIMLFSSFSEMMISICSRFFFCSRRPAQTKHTTANQPMAMKDHSAMANHLFSMITDFAS